MESKPAIEKFMQNCFQERTAALKRCLEISQVFRQRFYATECFAGSRAGVVERSEAETIVDISPLETSIGVATTGSTRNRRSRYHLKPSGKCWLIHEVDTECAVCRFRGVTANCKFCGGSGWLNRERPRSYNKFTRGAKRTDGVISRIPEGLTEARFIQNPAVDQFMADYFQERSESRKKELEIEADYNKNFYSPDGECAKRQASANEGPTETIQAIAPTDSGIHVFTNSPYKFWLRYDLRPIGPGWLIREVDMECTMCFLYGRRPACPQCRGTIWEQRKIRAERKLRKPPDDELPPERPRWQP